MTSVYEKPFLMTDFKYYNPDVVVTRAKNDHGAKLFRSMEGDEGLDVNVNQSPVNLKFNKCSVLSDQMRRILITVEVKCKSVLALTKYIENYMKCDVFQIELDSWVELGETEISGTVVLKYHPYTRPSAITNSILCRLFGLKLPVHIAESSIIDLVLDAKPYRHHDWDITNIPSLSGMVCYDNMFYAVSLPQDMCEKSDRRSYDMLCEMMFAVEAEKSKETDNRIYCDDETKVAVVPMDIDRVGILQRKLWYMANVPHKKHTSLIKEEASSLHETVMEHLHMFEVSAVLGQAANDRKRCNVK